MRYISSAVLMLLIFSLVAVGNATADNVNMLKKERGLVSTGAANSLEKDSSLFNLLKRKSGNILSTSSTDVNIHSHYRSGGASRLRSYTYTGQMMIEEENGGVGVTFYSRYPRADHYYRLRRYNDNSFHISPHGTEITSGDVETGVTPDAGVWYRFKVRVVSLRKKTKIYAKVWNASRSEPRGFQAICSDDSSTRRRFGKPGVWSMADGVKRWKALKVVTR